MQYSRTHSIAEAGLRGLTAGLRGVLEAKRMRREAQTDREHRMADQAYRNRLLALQQQQAAQQHAHQQGTLALQQEELDLQKAIEERNKQLADTNLQIDEQKKALAQNYYTDYKEYYILESQWKSAPPGSPEKAELNLQLIDKGAKLKNLAAQLGYDPFTGEEDRRALRDAHEKTAAERAHETKLQEGRFRHDKTMATDEREYKKQQDEAEQADLNAEQQRIMAKERENLEALRPYMSEEDIIRAEALINSGTLVNWTAFGKQARGTTGSTPAAIQQNLGYLEKLKPEILQMENGEAYYSALQADIESGDDITWTKVFKEIRDDIGAHVETPVGQIPQNLRGDYLALRKHLYTLKSYKDVSSRRLSYLTGMSAYIDAVLAEKDEQKGFHDIVLINTFQRMVDEGVSVREGDVHLIQSVQDIRSKIGLWLQKIQGESGALSIEARDTMINTMRGIYNSSVDTWNADESERSNFELDVAQFGLSEYMKPPIFERQDQPLADIVAAKNPRLGWTQTLKGQEATTTTPQTTQRTTQQTTPQIADDGEEATTITQETETFPGGFTRTHITNAAKRVQSNIEKGQPLDTALDRLRNNLKRKKLTDTDIEQIIDKVIELLPKESRKKKTIGQTIGRAILQPVQIGTNPGRSANHE